MLLVRLGGGAAPLIYDLLRWTGVAYLLYLAWETRQSNGKAATDIAATESSSLFWRGFFSNVFNPKSILFFISVVPGFIQYDPGGSGLLFQAARLGAIYIAIATSIHASIVLLAGQLRSLVMAGSRQTSIRRILSVALVLVAAWLAWSTRRTRQDHCLIDVPRCRFDLRQHEQPRIPYERNKVSRIQGVHHDTLRRPIYEKCARRKRA
jgi:threonine/homoserine/homoserine lactone efflux protein